MIRKFYTLKPINILYSTLFETFLFSRVITRHEKRTWQNKSTKKTRFFYIIYFFANSGSLGNNTSDLGRSLDNASVSNLNCLLSTLEKSDLLTSQDLVFQTDWNIYSLHDSCNKNSFGNDSESEGTKKSIREKGQSVVIKKFE
jgi:hypothetical protein